MAKKVKQASKAKKAAAPKKSAVASAPRPQPKKDYAPPKPSLIIPKKTIQPTKEVNERPLTDAQIQKFRDVLMVKRDELLATVQRKKEQEIQVGEIETGDEADIATRSVEREMLFELTDSEKQTLDMIEGSLRKIEKGVFGRCEHCRKPISKMRLEVMPWARYCIYCQSEQEIPVPEAPATPA
jgi:DnaK suppressor protein